MAKKKQKSYKMMSEKEMKKMHEKKESFWKKATGGRMK